MKFLVGSKALVSVSLGLLLGFLSGCAGLEYAPKRQYLWYHKELPAADRAVEAARAAGKDKTCPAEFAAAERMKNDAYETYWACRTREGIEKAGEATRMANALCPAGAAAPRPLPPPPPPVEAPGEVAPPPPLPAPTASLSADPAEIERGQCATLTWSTANASAASIDQGVGSVDTSGSRRVCPESTARYTLTATGDGGSRTAETTVTVKPPPPPERISLLVEFDTAKWDVKPRYHDEIARVADYMKRHPNVRATIEGHTDNVGQAAANQKLSLRRAEAVKKVLVDTFGIDPSRIATAGYGATRPVASNATPEGRQKNRRIDAVFSD